MKQYYQTIRSDLAAGIVVWLVALPLCLGIAMASGAPLFSGVLSAVIGGIVVGLLSESNVSVSGPANSLISVMLAAVVQLGSYQAVLFALFIAGILQIMTGLLRAGTLSDYVPENVIKGLLAAIGALIIIKQIPLAIGYDGHKITLQGLLIDSQNAFSLSPLLEALRHIDIGATTIAVVAIFIMIAWVRVPVRWCKMVPAPIVAVLIAVGLNALFHQFYGKFALNGTFLVSLPVFKTSGDFFSQIIHPDFSVWRNPSLYVYAVTIWLVASLETLLSLEAVEKLDTLKHYCSRNRELVAQGIGNSIAGLVGAMPITSVVIRSSVNINSGGKTKLSTIFHGLLMLVSLLFVSRYLNMIPLSALAAILIYTGYKLCSIGLFKSAYQQGWRYFTPFVLTVIVIVFFGLLYGVLIGLLICFSFILLSHSKSRFTELHEHHASGLVRRFMLPESVSFLNKAAIIASLNEIPNNSKVVIDAKNTEYIDHDILDIIYNFKDVQSKEKNILLNLEGFKSVYHQLNERSFMSVTSPDTVENLSTSKILAILKEGNERFLHNKPIHKDYQQQIAATAGSQHPMAIVLSCIDSRVPVELIFDLAIGDVFVSRVAGNIVNKDILASMEYACDVVGVKLIIVIGHTGCGAVKAACDEVNLGNITELVDKIKPAIAMETTTVNDRSSKNDQFVNHVAEYNVELAAAQIRQDSEILADLIKAEKVTVVGAMYDVKTGKVMFKD